MKLTIFTPTYNRKEYLNDLYLSIVSSLELIDDKDSVEWLIVDDGSKEDYKDVVNSFEEKNNLKITYIKKENGGKHTAFNLAIDKCDGDLFVCIDDDDRLTKNALKVIFELGKKYDNKGYGAIVGRVVDVNNNLLGNTVFKDVLVSNTIEIRDVFHFWGEPEVYYIKSLKKYRFDVFENERFLTEAYLFDNMSINYPFVYTNEPMMVKQYLKDGLTDNSLKIRVNSPIGAVNYYYQRVQLAVKKTSKIKAMLNKNRFGFWIKDKKNRKKTKSDFIIKPISYFIYLSDKRKMKKR